MPFEVLQSGPLPAVAAAAGTTNLILGELPVQECQASFGLARVSVVSPSLVTGNGLGTITIRQMRAGVQVAASIASLLLASGVNLAAETPVSVPVTSTTPLQAGDLLEVSYVQTSTGLALPANVRVQAEVG